MAMYGRHGESPMPVIAARTPADCFDQAIEAARIAIKYRTPVILLSDGYLANSSEPWLLPNVEDLEPIPVEFASGFNKVDEKGEEVFWPYLRDENMARPWAVPGTPDLMHRIGGLEKEDGSGNVSYDGANHAHMMALRAERIARIQVPDAEVSGDADADLLLIGWGSTWGAIAAAVRRVRRSGRKVAHVHLTHLNPMPANLGEVLSGFSRILVPEMNLGQLVRLLRDEFLVDAQPVAKVTGQPFTPAELQQVILSELGDDT
jgi:2-oxoglutarate ferredoxin oxidoreductase subunit alpha